MPKKDKSYLDIPTPLVEEVFALSRKYKIDFNEVYNMLLEDALDNVSVHED